jgi:nucleoside-diphosphate-sugar epimerase
MRVLVTGITGRIGANLARQFLTAGHEVRGFVWPADRQSAKLALIGAEIVEGDLADAADVRRAAEDQEVILHLGAAFQAGGPFTPEQYFDTNVKGTFNVLQAALGLRDRLKHLVIASTDATMDKYPPEGLPQPLREDSLPLCTTAWYGYSKVLCEHLVDRYVRADSLRATVVRFANVWGADEVLEFPQFYLRTFIQQLASRTDEEGRAAHAAMAAEPDAARRLIVACDRNGRPWKKHNLEVREILGAFEKLVGRENTFGRTYQLASREPFTWDHVVPYLAKRLDLPFSRFNVPLNPTFYEYDLTSARRDFGYAPTLSVQQMIDDAMETRVGRTPDSLLPTRIEAWE